MITEINKPNDIFVSTLLDPQFSAADLVVHGINSTNTQLLSPEEYKTSEFVKKQFTDETGKFDNDLFTKAYLAAANKYEEITSIKVMEDLHRYAKYDQDDIFAPLLGEKENKPFVVSRIKNPWQSTMSLTHLNEVSESDETYREIAQQKPIYDTRQGKFLDYTPEDVGLFKGIFNHAPMAYAKYTEDVEEFDPSIGRVVQHKKGELKLSPEGSFYVETVYDDEGYDREFVSIGDILTKENSWLNPVAFWENDDKHKSIGGVVAQTAAHIIPYLAFGNAWGAVAAAVAMAKTIPTLAKSIEGLSVHEGETKFTKKMNYWENYMRRFDRSMSDDAQKKLFSAEMIGQTVGDIFGQLYQMRAAAGLSKFAKRNWSKAEKAAVAEFNQKYAARFAEAKKAGYFKNKTANQLFKEMADQSPEIKHLIESTSKLSQNLSIGYMAITSASDVYQQAIEGGYDRRVAGIAALSSILGQYLLMSNNELGTWFLDAAVGYKEGVTRGMIAQALNPHAEIIKNGLKKLPAGATTEQKLGLFQKILGKSKSGLGKVWGLITEGAEDFWGKAGIEMIEEVSEEALFDLTKGVVDALNYFDLLGEKNKMGSFGGWDNVFSKEGAARYLQNALGGFLGGGLFHVQGNIIEPWLTGKTVNPETKKDLIQLLQEGYYDQVVAGIERLAKTDPDVQAAQWQVGDTIIRGSASGETMTRGQVLGKSLKSYVDYLQAVLSSKNLDNMTSSQLMEKAMRDTQVRDFLTDTGIHNLMLNDFQEATTRIVSLQEQIDSIGDNVAQAEKKKVLIEEQKTLIERVEKLMSGEGAAEYVQMSLAYAIPAIRDNLVPISKYTWTKANYDKSYHELPDTGVGVTKASVDAEYKKFTESTDKKQYLRQLLAGLNHIDGIVSSPLKQYVSTYKPIRQSAWKRVFSRALFSQAVDNMSFYEVLQSVHKATKTEGTSGLSLQDIIMPDVDDVYNSILKPYGEANKDQVKLLAKMVEMSPEEYLKYQAKVLANMMGMMPVEQWNETAVQATLIRSHEYFIEAIAEKVKKELKVEQLTPELVADWLSNHGMSLDPSLDITGKDPLRVLSIGTRPVLTDVIEDFSALVLDKYIQEEEVLDQEVLYYLKQRIIYDLCNTESKSALESLIFSSDWAEAANFENIDSKFPISSSAWNTITNILTSELDNFQPVEQIAEKIVNSETGLLQYILKEDRVMKQEYEDNPAYVDELKEIVIKWIKSSASTRLYENALNKQSHLNPLFDILRTTDFEMTNGQSMSVFNIIQEESNNLRNITDINEFLKMPDAIERIDSALSVISTVRAVIASMVESELKFGADAFGYNTQLNAHKDQLEGLEGVFETITMEDAIILNQDLTLLEQKLLFVKNLSAKNTDSKKEDDLKASQKYAALVIQQIKTKAAKLTFKGVSIFTDDDLATLDDTTLPVQIRLGRVEHNAHQQVLKILESMPVEQFAKELFAALEINRDEFFKEQMTSAGISKNTQALTQFDVFNYFVSILSTDSNKFYYVYDKILAKPEYDKVPFFVQELAARQAYSFLWDEIGLHDAMVDALYEGTEDGKVYPIKASSFIFIDGVTGAGKTTVAAMLALSEHELKKVGLIGPNKNQAEKLHVAVGSPEGAKVWNKEQLFKQFLTPEGWAKLQDDLYNGKSELIKTTGISSTDQWYQLDKKALQETGILKTSIDLPKLLVIDEATHFTSAELEILDYIAKANGIKILTLGDSFQNGASLKDAEDTNIRDIFRWSPPKIKLSNRPANINKKDNIDVFASLIEEFLWNWKTQDNITPALEQLRNTLRRVSIPLKYWESEDDLLGDKLVKDITVEDVNKLARAAKRTGGKVGFITKLDADGKPISDASGFNLQTVIDASELKDGDYVLYSPDSIHPNAAQGAEEDFVVVNLSDAGELNKSLITTYTMITRSVHGSLLRLPQNVVNDLNIRPQQTSRPGEYRMPGLDRRKDAHVAKQNEIKQILNGWVPTGTTPTAEPEPTPTPEPETTEGPDDGLVIVPDAHYDPGDPKRVIIGTADPEDTEPSATTGGKVPGISSYTFYTNINMEEDGGQYINTEVSPFNASALLPAGTVLSRAQARGFNKLKNIISLFQNASSSELMSLIKKFNADETNEIVSFIRTVFGIAPDLSETDVIRAFVNGLKIDENDYIVAKKFDTIKDSPIFKQGFDETKLLSDGEALIMPARKVTITIGGKTKTSYITVGAFPKATSSSTDQYRTFVEKVQNDLISQDNIIYSTNQRFDQLGTKQGRLVKHDKKYSFLTLQDLLQYGVNVKQIGLITSDQDRKSGQYNFIKFAKPYYSDIESMVLDADGNFTKAGCYYAIVGFDGGDMNSTRDHLILLTLDQVELFDVMKVVTDATKSFEDKLSILHEFSYSQLLLKVFDDANLFSAKNNTKIEQYFKDLKTSLESLNTAGHYDTAIQSIQTFLDQGRFDRTNVEKYIKKTTGICAYFFGKYARISGDKIIIHGPNGEGPIIDGFTYTGKLFKNVRPISRPNANGVCAVSPTHVLENLGLENVYYEPAKLFIPQEVLDNAEITPETTPAPAPAPAAPVETEQEKIIRLSKLVADEYLAVTEDSYWLDQLDDIGIIDCSVSDRWDIKQITEDGDGNIILTLRDLYTEEDVFKDIYWSDLKEKIYLYHNVILDANEFRAELYRRFPQAKNLDLQIDVEQDTPMSSTATIKRVDAFGNSTIIGEIYLDIDPFSVDESNWDINKQLDNYFEGESENTLDGIRESNAEIPDMVITENTESTKEQIGASIQEALEENGLDQPNDLSNLDFYRAVVNYLDPSTIDGIEVQLDNGEAYLTITDDCLDRNANLKSFLDQNKDIICKI